MDRALLFMLSKDSYGDKVFVGSSVFFSIYLNLNGSKEQALVKPFLLLFSACQEYQQHYDNFEDFNKVNQRNKGWFPPIVSKDAYELFNSSCLDSLCAFGSFS